MKKFSKEILPITKGIVAGLLVVAGISVVFAAYVEPTQAPTGGNPDAPINVGSANQGKAGGLSVGTFSALLNANFAQRVSIGAGITNPLGRLHIAGDALSNRADQIYISGESDPNKKLYIGINTTGDYASIEYLKELAHWGPLVLQADGGSVGVGVTSPNASLKMQVNGNVGANQYCDQNGANCIVPGGSSGMIPAGAVMAFNLSVCPAGWSSFTDANGRVILGTGNSGSNGASNHPLGDKGGQEERTLTTDQMPRHRHGITATIDDSTGESSGAVHGDNPANNSTFTAYTSYQGGLSGGAAGSANPVRTMDPYIALLYCVKN